MKKITLLLALLTFSFGFSQTFTDAVVHDMQNGSGGTSTTCGTPNALTLPLAVAGIGTLDANTTVLQSVTLNITHTWNSDVYIQLQDPSGATTVLLVQNIGGSGDGFTNCILADNALTALPTANTTPVTGTFLPLNPLSGFDGVNADGDWNLLVCDDAGGDVGTVDSWSLTFGAPLPPLNNLCADAIALDCTNNTGSGNTEFATDDDGDSSRDVWYSYTGTTAGDNVTASLCGSGFDTIITVYDACGGTELDSNDDFCGTRSQVSWVSDGTTVYLIKIQGYLDAFGDYEIEILCESTNTPANNDCATAEDIACRDTVTGNTTYASDSDSNGSFDVWYSYSGSVVGDNVTASLCGSGFDTTITVYDACGGTELAFNDDSSCGVQSEVSWVSDGVSTYIISVEGFNTSTGAFTLTMSCDSQMPPANDDCSDAITIACAGQYIGDTTFASPESPDPGTCGTSAGTAGAVWYTFTGINSNNPGATAGTTGDEVTLDLGLSTFDTKLRVFEGACGALMCVGGDDDGGTGATSLFTFTSTVGTDYFVLVHGFSGNFGAYTLDVSCVAPPLCTPTVVDSSTIMPDCDNSQFSVDVVVSTVGDGTFITDGLGGSFPVVVGTVSVGPYASGATVTLTLEHSDGNCDFPIGDFNYDCPANCATTPFPADGAINVPVGNVTFTWEAPTSGPTPTSYNLYAGETATGDDYGLIGNFLVTSADLTINAYGLQLYWIVKPVVGATESEGCTVWSFTTVDSPGYCLNAPSGQYPSATYTPATCDGTTPNNITTAGWAGEYSVVNVDAGQTYEFSSSIATDFITISDDDGATAVAYGITPVTWTAINSGTIRFYTHTDDQCGSQNVSRTRSLLCGGTLNVENFQLSNSIKYYPNPVTNTLTLNSGIAIQNVSVYNMLGQEVLRTTPNTVDSDVDMSSLQAGTYFVKVTVENTTKTLKIIKR